MVATTRKRLGGALTRLPRRMALVTAAAVVAAAAYLFDDALFAWPIVVLAALLGGWAAFLLLIWPYGLVSHYLTRRVLRWEARRAADRPQSKLMGILVNEEAPHGRLARWLLRGGTTAGFVFSSVFAGGILTSWLIRRAGRTRHIDRLAMASNAIFAVGFVGTYAGIVGWLSA